jgi:hypothetical protein
LKETENALPMRELSNLIKLSEINFNELENINLIFYLVNQLVEDLFCELLTD